MPDSRLQFAVCRRSLTGLLIVLERALARWTDAIITVSERLKRDLVQLRVAPADKIRMAAGYRSAAV